MLFIVIHQSYELWFKEILHELDYLKRLLADDDLPRANHTIRRVLTILKMLVAKVDTDLAPEISQRYGIRSIPTLMIFKDGAPQAQKLGAMSKSQLTEFLDSNL